MRAGCEADRTPALTARRFAFPRDDGAHDDFELEWWRSFGRVKDDAGRRFDFAVNVSRSATATKTSTVRSTASRWFTRRLVTTSYEFLDEQTLEVRRGTFVTREGAFGASFAPTGFSIVAGAVKYAVNRAERRDAEHLTLSLHDPNDVDDANAISLEQTTSQAALPLGPGGIMQTGSCVSDAAYAYAYPRNATQGVLRFSGVDHRVSGSTWIEHEFAHEELARRDAGWNRYEVQFDDGRDVDARFTRDVHGAIVATSGVFVTANGKVTYLTPGGAEAILPPEINESSAQWHSDASNVTYPALWYLDVAAANLRLATVELTHDQEIRERGRTPYYWGAIVVEKAAPPGGDSGHGFVELTGYDGRREL